MNADDIQYVFDHLDYDHVCGVAHEAREAWGMVRAFEIVYQPGDMTNYGLLFTILDGGVPILSAPGGGTMDGMMAYTNTGCRFDGTFAAVSSIQRGTSAIVGNRDFVEPAWVEKKFGYGPASSLALAVLFNEITGQDPGWKAEYVAVVSEHSFEEA